MARSAQDLAAEARAVTLPQSDTGSTGRHARRTMEVLGGRGTRLALLASLLAGLVIALLTVHLAGP